MVNLQPINDAVTGIETVRDSVIKLLGDLSSMVAAAKNDPVEVQAVADKMNALKVSLADAVVANTPAE